MRLETERLIIRSFERADIPSYHRIVSDSRVTKFLRNSSPHSIDEAARYIEGTMAEEAKTGIARYAVDEKYSEQFFGFCGFAKSEGRIDFGWRYGFEYWGKGYGTEAAIAVLDYGLRTLGLKSIAAGTSVENVASLKIIKKLGFDHCEYTLLNGRRVVTYYLTEPGPNKSGNSMRLAPQSMPGQRSVK